MQTLLNIIQEKCFDALMSAYPNHEFDSAVIEIAQSNHDKFGHYQCNSAMRLSKILQQPPRTIAEQIVLQFNKSYQSKNIISKIEIAGPGFINISLAPDFLAERAQLMLQDEKFGIDHIHGKHKLVIDFSSPNTAKEMHVGHLRSTIIGDCLARLFEFLGYDVLRLNHLGDWGTQFGMLIAEMKENAADVLAGRKNTDLSFLVERYRAGKKRFDDDEAFRKRAQSEVVALQSGSPESIKIWQLIRDISSKAYQEIYDLLDVKIIERGESFYNPFLADVVADLESKNLVQISDGAKCIFLEGFKSRDGTELPFMIQKSDGGYNYSTTDIAALRHRINDEKADRIIYVTDAGQAIHFAMLFKAAEKAGYYEPQKVRLDHVPFGVVLGLDGKKFRTRSGETERLIDLITSAIQQAKIILKDRNVELSEEQLNITAITLGINAIKYADLSCNRVSDYVFSYERMLRFEGNTAAFLMYAYVRVAGIKRKIGKDITQIPSSTKIQLEHPSEIDLGLHINRFAEMLIQLADDLLPNHLTEYLFVLAEKFNAFFRDCRVEGTAQQDQRLLLCELVAKVMHCGMNILGLRIIDRM